jgi:hypothetical protein
MGSVPRTARTARSELTTAACSSPAAATGETLNPEKLVVRHRTAVASNHPYFETCQNTTDFSERPQPIEPAAVTPTAAANGTAGTQKSGKFRFFLTCKRFVYGNRRGIVPHFLPCVGVPLLRRQAASKSFKLDAPPRSAWRVEDAALCIGAEWLLMPPPTGICAIVAGNLDFPWRRSFELPRWRSRSAVIGKVRGWSESPDEHQKTKESSFSAAIPLTPATLLK